MAVLQDLLARGRPAPRRGRWRLTLPCKNGRSDSLVLEGRLARRRVRRGHGRGRCDRADRAGAPRPPPGVLAPAFVDPHVHLRTPGREDEETIASGTAAAAAGGYCAILAMPNTDPSSTRRRARLLVEAARREALVPTGFMAAITSGSAARS